MNCRKDMELGNDARRGKKRPYRIDRKDTRLEIIDSEHKRRTSIDRRQENKKEKKLARERVQKKKKKIEMGKVLSSPSGSTGVYYLNRKKFCVFRGKRLEIWEKNVNKGLIIKGLCPLQLSVRERRRQGLRSKMLKGGSGLKKSILIKDTRERKDTWGEMARTGATERQRQSLISVGRKKIREILGGGKESKWRKELGGLSGLSTEGKLLRCQKERARSQSKEEWRSIKLSSKKLYTETGIKIEKTTSSGRDKLEREIGGKYSGQLGNSVYDRKY